MVDFHLPFSGSTPFALLCEEAFSQFRSTFVLQYVWFEVWLVVVDDALFELSGR
jgi:hypothetical protein